MLRVNQINAALVTVLSLAAALERFGTVGFFWKLFAILLSAIIVVYVAVDRPSKSELVLRYRYASLGRSASFHHHRVYYCILLHCRCSGDCCDA